MMDPVTLALLGLGAQLAVRATALLNTWLTLRARAALARAATDLAPGTCVSARDAGGAWMVGRTGERGRR